MGWATAAHAHQLLAPPSSPQVLTTFRNIDLTRKDMGRLQPGVWLNDEIINMYMALLQVRHGVQLNIVGRSGGGAM